mmetsp:Transcript_31857/g.109575  ORF Transcript_31857/g.109575 Transcript_31857/m.109575 type:complete len:451 (-) Transcript_31857:3706-5058(-)
MAEFGLVEVGQVPFKVHQRHSRLWRSAEVHLGYSPHPAAHVEAAGVVRFRRREIKVHRRRIARGHRAARGSRGEALRVWGAVEFDFERAGCGHRRALVGVGRSIRPRLRGAADVQHCRLFGISFKFDFDARRCSPRRKRVFEASGRQHRKMPPFQKELPSVAAADEGEDFSCGGVGHVNCDSLEKWPLSRTIWPEQYGNNALAAGGDHGFGRGADEGLSAVDVCKGRSVAERHKFVSQGENARILQHEILLHLMPRAAMAEIQKERGRLDGERWADALSDQTHLDVLAQGPAPKGQNLVRMPVVHRLEPHESGVASFFLDRSEGVEYRERPGAVQGRFQSNLQRPLLQRPQLQRQRRILAHGELAEIKDGRIAPQRPFHDRRLDLERHRLRNSSDVNRQRPCTMGTPRLAPKSTPPRRRRSARRVAGRRGLCDVGFSDVSVALQVGKAMF